MKITVSLVICTLDRCKSLEIVLQAVAEFRAIFEEMIIVQGPCTDQTNDVIKKYQHLINKVINTSSKNVSIARNLGLKAATKDIIVYLDDDVVPTKKWLESHINIYITQGENCGCVGGPVRDKTKINQPLQFNFGVNSLLSESKPILSEIVAKKYSYQSYWFKAVMGANVSYRRAAIAKMGGFDEFFEYFLEETDICIRLIQSGYDIYYTDVEVDHYPQPSHNREDQKHLTCWYSLGKNTTYFAFKHGYEKIFFPIFILRLNLILIHRCLLRIIRLKFTHNLPSSILIKYIQEALEGFRVGWEAGLGLHKNLVEKHN